MEIRRMGPIGAEVIGVDVKTMNDAIFGKIYQAWLDSNVICVRDQQLEIDDYLTYSRRFGVVCPHPSKITRHPDYPELTVLGINKFRTDGTLDKEVYRRGAEGFHTDGSYEEVPYKALPQRLKDKLDDKIGTFKYGGRKKLNALLDEADRHIAPVRHPLVQTHPETGRKLLYFDQGKILTIEGVSQAESDAIIDEMVGYFVEPPCQYRHQWRKGDIVIWDNRCSYHKAAGDYPPEEDRIHWRVSIKSH